MGTMLAGGSEGKTMRFRKMNEKYHFDVTFYLLVFGLAGVIGSTYYYGKHIYDRSRGKEVQALLDRENVTSIEAFRKQAKQWIANRTHGMNLTEKERENAEEIMAHALHKWVLVWTQGQMDGKTKEQIDQSQKVHWDAGLAEVNAYLESIGKSPVRR
jgi:hypothetical protein